MQRHPQIERRRDKLTKTAPRPDQRIGHLAWRREPQASPSTQHDLKHIDRGRLRMRPAQRDRSIGNELEFGVAYFRDVPSPTSSR